MYTVWVKVIRIFVSIGAPATTHKNIPIFLRVYVCGKMVMEKLEKREQQKFI